MYVCVIYVLSIRTNKTCERTTKNKAEVDWVCVYVREGDVKLWFLSNEIGMYVGLTTEGRNWTTKLSPMSRLLLNCFVVLLICCPVYVVFEPTSNNTRTVYTVWGGRQTVD